MRSFYTPALPCDVFSTRFHWNQPANRLTGLLEQKRRAGAEILDLTESNPTRAGFDYPREILQALADPGALTYDPSPRGLLSAREVVCEFYAHAIPHSRVLLTASTSEAYSFLFKLLADPGDEILAPRPSYPLFEFLAQLDSVSVRQYPLRYDGAWHIDFDALQKLITPRTRAIVVVNPNNPTGSFLKTNELDRLESFGLPILSDEVFSPYEFDNDPARVRTLIGPRRVLTFSMSGLSKIAALPQMKLGWIVASGPGHEDALHRLELIADTYLSVATPVQLALPHLISSPVTSQIQSRTRENLTTLQSALTNSPLQILNVEGGWYATLRVPNIRSEEDWTLLLLDQYNLLVQPGYFFDFEHEAFLVVSLLTRPDTFRQGLEKILQAAL